ncbi:MAG: SDR family NAD(P)-dependent oxidoreductase [Croceivirga sp.]
MDLRLKNKTALVTGSTAGIGLATAKRLISEGAKVILNGRSEDKLKQLIRELRLEYSAALIRGVAADFSNTDEIQALLNTIGHIDILVNNVGVYKAGSFFEMGDDDWYRQFEINVMSGVRLSRYFLPKMLKNDWGRILFVSSECAELVPPDMLAYSMTKTAMVSIAKGLAQLTKSTGVTINSILPGSTLSEGAEQFLEEEANKSGKTKQEVEATFFEEVRTSSLLQRFAEVDEVASTIVYYCSPLASASNGASIKVDGGSTGGLL